jgi:REP element-mobilizing transposase RayT
MDMEERAGRKHIRLQNYNYNTPGVYFLTICVENRRCLLSRIKGEGILAEPEVELSPYGEIAEKYINQLNDFYQNLSVESYVIMPNHIHVLLAVKAEISLRETTKQNSAVSRFVSTFKRFCNKEYGHNIWQARSYDHVIRDQADFDQHLRYIYENPFGWTKDELYSAE